jgi:staphylococcal nuclease domain-containing protein 1
LTILLFVLLKVFWNLIIRSISFLYLNTVLGPLTLSRMTDGNLLPPQQGTMKRGVVKQVLSGDAVVLLGPPSAPNGLPQEITVYLANISAPRLGKRPTDNSPGSPDEPFAWEAREFLRKKVIGQQINFVRDFIATSGREHGRIYIGGTSMETAENVAETGVAEGWLEVRPGKQVDEQTQKLLDLQEKAKSQKKGKWGVDEADYQKHVRDIKWNIEDPRTLVDKYAQKPIKAVIEQVRDGSTVRAFLLPDFEYVTIMLSGVKAPSAQSIGETTAQPFGEEAKFFVEQRVLHRDVEVILEGTSNQNFMGSVLHPRGNIAEFLLKEGYAKCVDWSIGIASAGAATLREAEKTAKDRKLRLWRNYTGGSANGVNKKTFQGLVTEVGLGDSLTVEKDDGEEIKIYLSSLRPPRREGTADGAPATVAGGRKFLPLYDIPYMFEAREFLRKKLVGKRAQIAIDYVQPRSEQFPEKTCATVIINGQNIAQQLVERGLAKVIRHRQDDDNRSSAYDALMVAEANAEKEKKGLFSEKKEGATVRVQELQGDAARSKQFLSYFLKSPRNDGVVEFVSSGSRLRIYVPKESVIITFLLGGITAPRGARMGPGGKMIGENEPFAEEALKFTKKYTLQKEVKFEVETTDKAGGFIGYLFVQKEGGGWINLSELLVENGFASVHFSAERGSYYTQLSSAERSAKNAKRGIWQNYVEEEEVKPSETEQANDNTERKVNYRKVAVSEVSPDSFRFAAQNFDDAGTIEKLMKELKEIDSSSAGTTRPKKNELIAVQFSGQWHRARVEAIKGDTADIYYIDYGNRESVSVSKIAPLPARFQSSGPLCREYLLALVTVPNDDYYSKEAASAFAELAFSHPSFLLNSEYKNGNLEAVTLVTDDEKKRDIGKQLVIDGFALVETRREGRLKSLVEQYTAAEQEARKGRKNIWQYGDFTGSEL